MHSVMSTINSAQPHSVITLLITTFQANVNRMPEVIMLLSCLLLLPDWICMLLCKDISEFVVGKNFYQGQKRLEKGSSKNEPNFRLYDMVKPKS